MVAMKTICQKKYSHILTSNLPGKLAEVTYLSLGKWKTAYEYFKTANFTYLNLAQSTIVYLNFIDKDL